MRAFIQRVAHASVEVEENIVGEIQQGLLVLLGITHEDAEADIQWLVRKILQLRVFNDEAGKMNLSVQDIQGEILLISQFTLYANSKKGNRPSYNRSAPPDIAIPIYERFIQQLVQSFEGKVATGEFGGDMKVNLLNDGPVSLLLDSQQQDI